MDRKTRFRDAVETTRLPGHFSEGGRSSPSDIYEQLLTAAEVEVPAQERSEPPCCDELGEPPADASLAQTLAAAVSALPPRPRRRR